MLNGGDVFAGFTIERLLGQGGMGSVYLARHPRLGKLTALKLLNRELYADREIRARFEREADLVARLDHPNIVEVYDRGTEDEMLWISMQYVDGVDAAGVNVATLPPERAVQVIEGVADALDYAHGMGVLHRDVKPANIILARAVGGHGERVFLTDFGIARLREDSTHLTQAGMFTATLAYASPEQMTGAPLDPTTDQYSLACALYWLLIGMGPFDSPHPGELIHGHLQLLPPPVSLRRPGLSPAMDAVLTKAMAKRPADRFPTCTDFAKAARRALSGPPAQHPAHQPPRPAYPNPPAPQPNYAAPYPAPPYQVPPVAYAPTAVPPNPPAYPAPPQSALQPGSPQPAAPQQAAVPNYPAPQPQSAPLAPPPPEGSPAYPVQPQPPAAYPGADRPAASPPVPQQPQRDADHIGSGPTVRPYPQAPEIAPAVYAAPPAFPPAAVSGYPVPQPGHEAVVAAPPPVTADQVGSGPMRRPQGVGDEVWQRPTDVVPQPVVSAGRPEESAEAPAESAALPGEEAGSAGAGSAVPVTVETSDDVAAHVAPEHRMSADLAATEQDSPGSGDRENAASTATPVGGEAEAGSMARHPDSGAFVPKGANDAIAGGVAPGGAIDAIGRAVEGPPPAEFVVSEPVSAGVELPGSGPVGMPGQGYGPPPFGVGPAGPGLVPVPGRRAEASSTTALVVLGLAVAALVVLVAVAVVVVSG
ncbi:serine/threonine-protein kinase [Nocardia tengchongensis]|uniref:serine/threonine-protein kinase n=1 Tax=Nocardia tengchongensis TaxID=2055889 RepID=UPI00367F5558